MPHRIRYSYDRTGSVRCQNAKGLTFFLQGDPRAPLDEQSAPETPAPRYPQAPQQPRTVLEFLKG